MLAQRVQTIIVHLGYLAIGYPIYMSQNSIGERVSKSADIII